MFTNAEIQTSAAYSSVMVTMATRLKRHIYTVHKWRLWVLFLHLISYKKRTHGQIVKTHAHPPAGYVFAVIFSNSSQVAVFSLAVLDFLLF